MRMSLPDSFQPRPRYSRRPQPYFWRVLHCLEKASGPQMGVAQQLLGVEHWPGRDALGLELLHHLVMAFGGGPFCGNSIQFILVLVANYGVGKAGVGDQRWLAQHQAESL